MSFFKTANKSRTIQDLSLSFLAIVALFISLNVHGYDYTFYLQSIVLFLLCGLIILKLFYSYETPMYVPNTAVISLFTAFFIWIGLSIFWASVSGESFLITLTFSSGLLAMLLGFWATDKQWLYFRLLLIPLALLVVALTSYQAFVLKMPRPAGFLLNWNTNSAFLSLIVVPYCANYLQQITQKRPIAWLTGLFLACCTFGMALGQGRASLLVLFIALAILLFAYRTQERAYRGIALTLVWIIGGFALGDLLHGGFLGQRLMSSVQTISAVSSIDSASATSNNIASLGSGREYLWSAGWKMYLDKPFFGWGIGAFHWLYPSYHDPLYIEDGHYAHNDYLEFLIELGPIGLLLCLSWIVALFIQFCKLFKAQQDTKQQIDNLGLFLAAGAMLLHTSVDFHLYHLPMLILLGSYIGRLSSQYNQQNQNRQIAIKFKDISGTKGGYFSILALVSLFISIGLLNISHSFLALKNAELTNNPLEKFQTFDKAERFLPFVELFQIRPVWLILDLVKTQPDALPIDERDMLLNYALNKTEAAIKNNPLSAPNHLNKAELLSLLKGDNNEITKEFEQSLTINPYQLKARLMLARHLLSINEKNKALHVLADGFNKSYIDNPAQVMEYYKQVDLYFENFEKFASQRQLIEKQIAGMKSIHPQAVHVFTLPDIGWNP